MTCPLVIIGGGLSGLAAGIRFARFDQPVLLLEQHNKPGGLNSYYRRHGLLLESGLHAVTNFAPAEDKAAPLNRLFRQLKLKRHDFPLHQQIKSEVRFPGRGSLVFSNDFQELVAEVETKFPQHSGAFAELAEQVKSFDAFTPAPRRSARELLMARFGDRLFVDLLLCPLLFYGSAEEDDMDFSQFVILFRAIYLEGMFRPQGTIKDLLDRLLEHYRFFGGEIRYNARVEKILCRDGKVWAVRLQSGEEIECRQLLSTIGHPETRLLLDADCRAASPPPAAPVGRLSFMESISFLPRAEVEHLLPADRTIIFYNTRPTMRYRRPEEALEVESGVICFPENFTGIAPGELLPLRITHMANYDIWQQAWESPGHEEYRRLKELWTGRSRRAVAEIVGNCWQKIVYEDVFTPVTIKRFTGRLQGAVYGSPHKLKSGRTEIDNLFIAGTDQGFLGIVGAMLSGVTVVNQHLLG